MIEIRSEIDRSLAQPLEDFFCELVRSPWLIFHEKVGAPHFLMGYFDSEAEALDAWADLRKAFGMLPERPIVGTLEDRDWKEAYKANLHPWNCGRLHWVPEWRRAEYPVPAGAAGRLRALGFAGDVLGVESENRRARERMRNVLVGDVRFLRQILAAQLPQRRALFLRVRHELDAPERHRRFVKTREIFREDRPHVLRGGKMRLRAVFEDAEFPAGVRGMNPNRAAAEHERDGNAVGRVPVGVDHRERPVFGFAQHAFRFFPRNFPILAPHVKFFVVHHGVPV